MKLHIFHSRSGAVCNQRADPIIRDLHRPPDELAQRSFPTIQCDIYTVSGNQNVLIMVDTWTKFIAVEPSRNKLQSVFGGAVARFLGELGYYDQVELAFDNEPVLAAGMRSAQTIRAAQGLPTVLSLDNFLAEDAHLWQRDQFKLCELKASF